MTPISYTNIANKETGLSARTKINTLGANISTFSNDVLDKFEEVDNSISSLDTRLDTVELVKGIISAGTSTTLAIQSVSMTPSKLLFMSSELFKKGTAINSNLAASRFTINKTSIYTIGGSITFEADNNTDVIIELYVNSNPSGALTTVMGKGTNKVTASWFGGNSFNNGDTLELYVYSASSTIKVTNASVVIEEK